MINLGAHICRDFQQASAREWLETNGIGGFACGTVSGANTRRYHGLLTAATRPPLGRVTMLSKFEETLRINGKNFELSSNQYPNAIYPRGFQYLKNFRLAPFPIWTYEVEGIELEKSVFMVHGENTTVCRWSLVGGRVDSASIEIELKPLLSFTDYHAMQSENDELNRDFEAAENLVVVKPYAEMPALYFAHNAARTEKSGFWYRNFEYAIEKERGFDFHEDLFQPFVLRFELERSAVVVVSLEKHDWREAEEFEKREIERREELVRRAKAEDDFTRQMVLAADQFIVSRGDGNTVIAGYPWFSDWGRDTMIALPGLTLATNREEIGREILLEFSRHISEGMLPNRFPDAGETAEYNTVDATLWYFEAVRAYVEKTGDYDFVRENLYEKLTGIIGRHLQGTRYKIHVDTDGLLYSGEAGVQLTWMDAKIGDFVVTPRKGKPVEIQALWYNALKIMADFAERFDETQDRARFEAMASAAHYSFNQVFWNEAEQCLFDVVDKGKRDGAVRPNQIFAISLKYPIVEGERAKKIFEKVEKELLTPVGLRSLSPKDAQYVPVYEGSPFKRDSAYHQGTVWAWLIGAFIDARRRLFPDDEAGIEKFLSGFKSHLCEAGLGQISEIFDADAPHAPRGCFAQAWSVAEILRGLKKSGVWSLES
jgi:glycogen debranching enzyme, archaeal type, putative